MHTVVSIQLIFATLPARGSRATEKQLLRNCAPIVHVRAPNILRRKMSPSARFWNKTPILSQVPPIEAAPLPYPGSGAGFSSGVIILSKSEIGVVSL